MNFHKTPTNYNDINSFLPDSMTLCNKNYWEKKIDGLPDGYTDLLEALSRIEFSDQHVKQIANNINRNAIEFNNKIEQELLDRMNELTDQEEINKLLLENKNIAIDYYNAKPSILSNDILNSNISE
jgi:archaellum component FlaC